jgi:hypothetical protein
MCSRLPVSLPAAPEQKFRTVAAWAAADSFASTTSTPEPTPRSHVLDAPLGAYSTREQRTRATWPANRPHLPARSGLSGGIRPLEPTEMGLGGGELDRDTADDLLDV